MSDEQCHPKAFIGKGAQKSSPRTQEGIGSVRFVSVPDFSKNRFGSVREIKFPGSMRFGLCFSDAWWLGSVRFGSFPRPLQAGSRIKGFGSVRPVWFAFLFLPDKIRVTSNRESGTILDNIAPDILKREAPGSLCAVSFANRDPHIL